MTSTMAQVAKKARVSVSTVSHVLNNTRHVSPEKTRVVRDAIAALEYRPNTLARSLKTSSSSSVGLAISAISNPYFNDFICAVEAECAKLGLMVLLSDTQDDPERELAAIKVFQERRVDGVLLAPTRDHWKTAQFLRGTQLPCVMIDRLANDQFDQVGLDNQQAMRLLVEHVVALGHKRIGLIAGQAGLATTTERAEAFRRALSGHGLVVEPSFVSTPNDDTAAATASTHAMLGLTVPPTVLITGNNMATIGAMRATRQIGLSVPDDISLVGFDDFEWADCFDPQLTLVAQPCAEIGRLAAERLAERIAAPSAAVRTMRLAAELKIRNSCKRI